MPTSYSTLSGHQATYYLSPSGNAMVNVQSTSPLKFRAIYVGTARMQFMWVSSGKSSHWQFTPTLKDPTPAQFSIDSQNQNVAIELGNRLFPAAGIIKTNVTGEILAPAIHFDIPYATDLWVFFLRSAWYPIKISFDKPALSISHDSAQATAELQSGTGGFGLDEGTLKAYVSTFGEDFKKVTLKIKRKVGNASLDQLLGEMVTGSQPFIWKPIFPNFDTILVGNSTININQFLDFLKSLGAKTQEGFFTGSYLQGDFFLGDSPTVNYSLELNGDRGFLRSSKDETRIILQPQSLKPTGN